MAGARLRDDRAAPFLRLAPRQQAEARAVASVFKKTVEVMGIMGISIALPEVGAALVLAGFAHTGEKLKAGEELDKWDYINVGSALVGTAGGAALRKTTAALQKAKTGAAAKATLARADKELAAQARAAIEGKAGLPKAQIPPKSYDPAGLTAQGQGPWGTQVTRSPDPRSMESIIREQMDLGLTKGRTLMDFGIPPTGMQSRPPTPSPKGATPDAPISRPFVERRQAEMAAQPFNIFPGQGKVVKPSSEMPFKTRVDERAAPRGATEAGFQDALANQLPGDPHALGVLQKLREGGFSARGKGSEMQQNLRIGEAMEAQGAFPWSPSRRPTDFVDFPKGATPDAPMSTPSAAGTAATVPGAPKVQTPLPKFPTREHSRALPKGTDWHAYDRRNPLELEQLPHRTWDDWRGAHRWSAEDIGPPSAPPEVLPFVGPGQSLNVMPGKAIKPPPEMPFRTQVDDVYSPRGATDARMKERTWKHLGKPWEETTDVGAFNNLNPQTPSNMPVFMPSSVSPPSTPSSLVSARSAVPGRAPLPRAGAGLRPGKQPQADLSQPIGPIGPRGATNWLDPAASAKAGGYDVPPFLQRNSRLLKGAAGLGALAAGGVAMFEGSRAAGPDYPSDITASAAPRVPHPTAKKTAPSPYPHPTAVAKTPGPTIPAQEEHTIKSGDTLQDIANDLTGGVRSKESNRKLSEILRLNPQFLKDPAKADTGAVLTHEDVDRAKVKTGQTLYLMPGSSGLLAPREKARGALRRQRLAEWKAPPKPPPPVGDEVGSMINAAGPFGGVEGPSGLTQGKHGPYTSYRNEEDPLLGMQHGGAVGTGAWGFESMNNIPLKPRPGVPSQSPPNTKSLPPNWGAATPPRPPGPRDNVNIAVEGGEYVVPTSSVSAIAQNPNDMNHARQLFQDIKAGQPPRPPPAGDSDFFSKAMAELRRLADQARANQSRIAPELQSAARR